MLTTIGIHSQGLPTDGQLTVRPMLQQLGEQLLQGKQGSIVAIRPETGEIICLSTNSPSGFDVNLAIAKAYAPGSTFKVAQALTLLSEGVISPDMSIPCTNGFTDGNIHVGCHKHISPLALKGAIAQSCNTWFLTTFMSMINDRFMYEDGNEAITTWADYMKSMGLGGPVGVDIPGEKGGLVANMNYLSRRYKDGWDGKTIMWAGMGQGDITATPLQLCNMVASIANRGYYITPHIHQATENRPLSQRYLTKRQTKVAPEAYAPVIDGMRLTVENSGADHSVFVGFAPMDNPQIAIAVYVEHGGFGADLAAPIASLIIELYLKGQLSQSSQNKAKRIASRRISAEK